MYLSQGSARIHFRSRVGVRQYPLMRDEFLSLVIEKSVVGLVCLLCVCVEGRPPVLVVGLFFTFGWRVSFG